MLCFGLEAAWHPQTKIGLHLGLHGTKSNAKANKSTPTFCSFRPQNGPKGYLHHCIGAHLATASERPEPTWPATWPFWGQNTPKFRATTVTPLQMLGIPPNGLAFLVSRKLISTYSSATCPCNAPGPGGFGQYLPRAKIWLHLGLRHLRPPSPPTIPHFLWFPIHRMAQKDI